MADLNLEARFVDTPDGKHAQSPRRANPNGQWGLNRGQIKKQCKLPARFPLSVTFLSRRILVDREETKSPARDGSSVSVCNSLRETVSCLQDVAPEVYCWQGW